MDYGENTDMEVAHVLASGFSTTLPPSSLQNTRIGGVRSQPSLAARSSLTPPKLSDYMRPGTAMTNLIRGNRSAETPVLRPLNMHKLAAQGEIAAVTKHLSQHAVDELDDHGLTSLMWAASYNQLDMVKYLIDKNANVRLKARDGGNVLSFASSVGNDEIVDFLLSSNYCDVNDLDIEENTALMHACNGGHVKCVELLLSYGADIAIRNKYQLSAFDIAVKTHNRSVQSILESFMMKLFV